MDENRSGFSETNYYAEAYIFLSFLVNKHHNLVFTRDLDSGVQNLQNIFDFARVIFGRGTPWIFGHDQGE